MFPNSNFMSWDSVYRDRHTHITARIPQAFYDILGRVVPGSILILSASVLNLIPDNLLAPLRSLVEEQLAVGEKSASIAFWMGLSQTFIFFLFAYFVGFITPSRWAEWPESLFSRDAEPLAKAPCAEISASTRTEGAEALGQKKGWVKRFLDELRRTRGQIERADFKALLDRHNEMLMGLGREPLPINVDQLPRVYVMLDHLRLVVPVEAFRLVKLRSEINQAETLIIGFSGLGILLAAKAFLGTPPVPNWPVMEAIIVSAVVVSHNVPKTLYRRIVNGTGVLWLALASSNQLPLYPVQSAGSAAPEKRRSVRRASPGTPDEPPLPKR